jgi:hypothetical protein
MRPFFSPHDLALLITSTILALKIKIDIAASPSFSSESGRCVNNVLHKQLDIRAQRFRRTQLRWPPPPRSRGKDGEGVSCL